MVGSQSVVLLDWVGSLFELWVEWANIDSFLSSIFGVGPAGQEILFDVHL